MLTSVSLEQPVRSSSCRPSITRSEVPSCSLKVARSSSVTRRGFSSNGILGGWKKPMFPKVWVKLGPLSSCYVVKSYGLVLCVLYILNKLEWNIQWKSYWFFFNPLYCKWPRTHFEIWMIMKLITGANHKNMHSWIKST